ncbi:YihY/virulence factor BrkB family protein, partial [Limosilactobacillus vaginalis]
MIGKLNKAKLKNLIAMLVKHFTLAQLSSSAATLAYYTLLSIFPALLVIGNLLPMIGLDANTVLTYLQTLVPATVYSFIRPLVLDFLQRGSGGVLTTGALIALWSTSQGIAAFQRSVNHAYGIAENQNPVSNRVISFIWMIVVVIIIFVIVFLYGVGEQFLKWLQPFLHFNRRYIFLFSSLKWPITFAVIFIALTMLY